MTKYALLIPAAGVGARMKIGYPKQYMPVSEKRTLLEVTLNRLHAMGLFSEIAVVVAPTDPYIDHQNLPTGIKVFRCGGATRGESVLNGLRAFNLSLDTWVFVHDAARPCVTKKNMMDLIQAIEKGDVDGAILAQPMTDTVKWVNEEGIIEKTLDRRRCWRAQTPQAFQAGSLIQALQKGPANFTDEASAMEALSARIKVVEGSANNMKVTHPEDVALVKKLISDLGEQL